MSKHRRRTGVWFVLSWLALSALGCADLSLKEEGVCGNDVAEPGRGEDCDCGDGLDAHTCDVLASDKTLKCAAPSEPHGCRYLCAAATDCPAGWGCGIDGVCRSLTSAAIKFENLSTAAGIEAQQIETADFDGDGRDDLLAVGSTRASALFYEPNGEVAGIEKWSTSGVSPAAGAIAGGISASGRPLDDIALGIGIGMNVFRGRGGRTFLPTTYETLSIASDVGQIAGKDSEVKLVAPAASMTIADQKGVLSVDAYAIVAAWQPDPNKPTLAGSIARYVRGTAANPKFANAKLQQPITLAGLPKLPLPSAELDGDGLAEIVVAPVGETVIGIYSPFVVGGSGAENFIVAPKAITLRSALGKTYVAGNSFLYDIDGDADLDVLVGATCPFESGPGQMGGPLDGYCFELQVSYNTGPGTWSSQNVDGMNDLKASLLFQVTPALEPGTSPPRPGENMPYLPLALGELNGDGILDAVTGKGIALGVGVMPSPMPSSFEYVVANKRASFSEALIVDGNRDQHPDVFAASIAAPDMTFYANDGTGLFSTSYLPTDGPVSQMISGDFDGDFTQDIALAEWDGPSPGLGAHVFAVSFGRAYGVPEQPVEMSSFEEIIGLSTLVVSSSGADVADDVSISYRETIDGAEVIASALITGTPTRQLQTPFLMYEPQGNGQFTGLRTPQALFAGNFGPTVEGELGRADIIALTSKLSQQEPPKLTFIESTGSGKLSLGATNDFDALSVSNVGDPFFRGIVVNLDGGLDKLLLAGEAPLPPVGMPPSNPGLGALAIVQYAEGTSSLTVFDAMSTADTKLYRSLRAVDIDVTASNGVDVLAIGYTKEGVMQGNGGGHGGPGGGSFFEQQTWITLFRNDGQGKLCWDPAGPASCKPIELQLFAADGALETVFDVDVVNIDADVDKEIVALTSSRVVIVELGTNDKGDPALVEVGTLDLSIQEGWSAVRRCDVNGDGVDDLALSQADRLYVYGGIPERR